MRPSTIQTIFKKELLDTLRDRRTLIFMLAVPLLAMPLLLSLMSHLVMGQISKERKEVSSVVVVGTQHLPPVLLASLNSASNLVVTPGADADRQDIGPRREQLQSGDLDALVVVPDGFAEAIGTEAETALKIYYDSAELRSEFTVDKLESIFRKFKDSIVQVRLQERGVSSDLLTPFAISKESVATMRKMAGQQLGAMLPYIIILMCFLGAMYPAIDLAAGEKERGTLETLLISPASRGEFVIGKYLVILFSGTVAALLALVSMTISMNYLVEDQFGQMAKSLALEFDVATVGLILLILLPMAGLFAAVLLSVSVFARSFKEAQSYITVLNLIVILPAFVSVIPGIKTSFGLALIPVANVSLIMKDAISGTVAWDYVAVAFVSSLLFTSGAILFAKNWFERESVLFRT